MERFVFGFCSLAILAGLTPTESSTAAETIWNARDVRSTEDHSNLLEPNNAQNDTKHFLLEKSLVDNATQVGEHTKNLLTTSATSTENLSSNYIKDTQHPRSNGHRDDDGHHKEEPFVDLSSHDVLLDPSLIRARLTRQAEKGDAVSSNLASIEKNPRDVRFNNNNKSKSILSKRSFKGDLNVAEDSYYQPRRPYYQPPYSYYQKQFPNQRYWANNRREPYRNYWSYPVFPGK
ncbi:hypothetical protein PUN28_013254 [Cardiocondyla obscurior]|uniref:Uncharacterized protein n=1 Tax=Cardiocondyla obscurior TaxID=286306 RepID=A0AAW2FA39_9HYME